MKKLFVFAVVLGVVGFLMADDVYAHGGSFRGPNGGVPPGLREPSDPEPPPPPPSDPGAPSGPTTPTGPGPAPETPPDTGHETPNNAPPPAPVGPGQGPQKKAATKSLTFESWRFWWAYNNDDILNLKSHIYSARTSSSSPIFFSSKKDEENRRNAQRPTERAVMKTIIPALLRTLNRKGDNEDIHGGALVALGKVGSSKYIPIFEDSLWNRYKNDKGQRLDFGYQATESAMLAFGLLPNLEDSAKETVRRICINALNDDKLRTRERSWAAVCLGLQNDGGAVRPLIDALQQKYSDENIPCGILAGIGLIGPCEETQAILPGLIKALEEGDLFGQNISGNDRTRAFAGYAITKIGDAKALPAILKIIGSRRAGRVIKRSAVIAAGVLAANSTDQDKDDAVHALTKYIRKSGGDPSGENFALIGLSQIGTPRAINTLLDVADNGKYGHRPFAGLGLATMVFYRDRAAENGTGKPMDKDVHDKIVAKLIKLSSKYKDADTKAAFMLARGLVRDKTAIEELANTVAKKSAAPVLRGFCCVSLGLLGDAGEHVKDALKLALRERKSTDLRRDAATGLGLLRDAEVVKLLLGELKKAKSFAVQGQLITAIGTIGDHTAIDPLVNILDDRSQPLATRAMAAVGLGMIGDLRPLPPLGRISKNYNYRASVNDLDELLFIL